MHTNHGHGADIFYELIARLDGTRLVGQVITDGQPSLVLFYANGGTYYYYLRTVMGGSWRDDSYKYATEWGTSRCR